MKNAVPRHAIGVPKIPFQTDPILELNMHECCILKTLQDYRIPKDKRPACFLFRRDWIAVNKAIYAAGICDTFQETPEGLQSDERDYKLNLAEDRSWRYEKTQAISNKFQPHKRLTAETSKVIAGEQRTILDDEAEDKIQALEQKLSPKEFDELISVLVHSDKPKKKSRGKLLCQAIEKLVVVYPFSENLEIIQTFNPKEYSLKRIMAKPNEEDLLRVKVNILFRDHLPRVLRIAATADLGQLSPLQQADLLFKVMSGLSPSHRKRIHDEAIEIWRSVKFR